MTIFNKLTPEQLAQRRAGQAACPQCETAWDRAKWYAEEADRHFEEAQRLRAELGLPPTSRFLGLAQSLTTT